MGRVTVPSAQGRRHCATPVELRLADILARMDANEEKPVSARTRALPPEAQWRFDRPLKDVANGPRSQTTRRLEARPLMRCEKLSQPCPDVRDVKLQHHKPTSQRPNYVMRLFFKAVPVARRAPHAGFQAREWDESMERRPQPGRLGWLRCVLHEIPLGRVCAVKLPKGSCWDTFQARGIKGGGTDESQNRYKGCQHHNRSTDGVKRPDIIGVIYTGCTERRNRSSRSRQRTEQEGDTQEVMGLGEATESGETHHTTTTGTAIRRQPVLLPTSNRRRRYNTSSETSRTQPRSSTTTHTHGATSNASLGAKASGMPITTQENVQKSLISPSHGHHLLPQKVGLSGRPLLQMQHKTNSMFVAVISVSNKITCGLRTPSQGGINTYHSRHRLSACFARLSPCTGLICSSSTVCIVIGQSHFLSDVSLGKKIRSRIPFCGGILLRTVCRQDV